ncbi:hypothetical protein FDP41_012167 [Naegleria fowleri]|uniref:Chromo domain-containing protein n=1 Tax=Naegleria fowleri TaxID=5763 RepID=A0A6A5C8B0_NAEFO|nr:uncharacterized protein FDP41_012166 [Naegleria fowleri]XP_044566223.1 uncharacterized protein FDP41_012167 [Naegleria fowleri]KAF0981509.1 hypothetical protein FDP41_012166 [Naegleria fowleri]KAF0981510.1 hypothetical protein FDP41_012167 [Naegleria fowleri]
MKTQSPSLDEEDSLSDSHRQDRNMNSDIEKVSDHTDDEGRTTKKTRNGKKRKKSNMSELSDDNDDSGDKEEASRKEGGASRNSAGSSTTNSQKKKPTRRMIDKTKKKKEEEKKDYEDDDGDEQEYEVETILLSKKKQNKVYYLVKWKGWPVKDSTWEPTENLSNISNMIEQFEKRVAPTLDKKYKQGQSEFLPEKITDSRKVKNKTEYLVQWKNYPVQTWEPDTSVRRSLITKYKSENGIRFQKIIGGKSIASASKDQSSDSETQVDSDPEIPEPPSKKQKNPSPSTPSSPNTSSRSSKSKNIQTVSEQDLAHMDFNIASVKKKHNSFQVFVKDMNSGTLYVAALQSLRTNEKHLQKLVDYLLSKIVFDNKKKHEEH